MQLQGFSIQHQVLKGSKNDSHFPINIDERPSTALKHNPECHIIGNFNSSIHSLPSRIECQ
uniref:Uncharacterized protein n=1 Tax=Moniliophthora roreri TaxID=221103 RepID=A0A0W0FRD1_MONRR